MTNSAKKLLLVDDDPDIVWSIGKRLTREGYSLVTCGDGAEAIDLMEAQDFDVVITDIQMPNVNGLTLIDWVRKNRQKTRIVAMTAFGSPALQQLTLRKGALLYLQKPVDPDILIEVVHNSASPDSFSGSIDEINLFDYVQLILMNKRQTLLEVSSRDGRTGALFMDKGVVLHATSGELEGEEAFYRCLAFKGGSFSTLPWREPERITIDRDGEYLLLEAARRIDEAGMDDAE